MKINVHHIAKLANLSLTKDEETKFESQLSTILDFVKILDKVPTDNIIETAQVTGLENIVREDTTQPSLTQGQALSGTPASHNSLFKVKAIMEDK